MDSIIGRLEQSIGIGVKLVSCGIDRGTEILRYRHNDGRLSGVVFRCDGGLLSNRHVIDAHKIKGFKYPKSSLIDIAFKADRSSSGLPLGYVEYLSRIGYVELLASSIEDPNNLVLIPGRIGGTIGFTNVNRFEPKDLNSSAKFFKRGLSGSPIIYNNHIIGIISSQNEDNPYEIGAEVFSGGSMKEEMTQLGLTFEEIV
jgi:hypothetical protein